MARERGQAGAEAGISMRSWGWAAYACRDATICHRCKNVVFPGAGAGTWDYPTVGIPVIQPYSKASLFPFSINNLFIDVEVKAATTSLPFSDLRDDQRLWAEEHPEKPKWLWICLGDRITSKVRPRKTVLVPLGLFLELEAIMERRSLPYICPALDRYKLEWAGSKTWSLPLNHPIRARYNIREEYDAISAIESQN